MRKRTSRMALAVLALILIRGVVGCWAEMHFGAWQHWGTDFWNYYVAAGMVRARQSAQIYLEPGPAFDPTEEYAAADSPFARLAHAEGIEIGAPYDYPPTLADLVVPLSYLKPAGALGFWEVFSLCAALGSACLLCQLLQLKPLPFIPLVSALILAFRPTLVCFFWGQVEVILLLVLLGAIALYVRGHAHTAALLFAIAAAIKLTPLLIIVPLIAWRDWKALRTFTLACGAILLCLVAVNGWPAVSTYVFHVLPLMTSKSIDVDNRSLISALQVMVQRTTQGTPLKSITLAGRFIALFVIGYAAWQIRLAGDRSRRSQEKVDALSVFLLLSCCLSPLSWIHAYVFAIPALAIAVKRICDRNSDGVEIVALVLFFITLSSERSAFLETMTPWPGIAFSLWFLRRIGIVLKQGVAEDPIASSIA